MLIELNQGFRVLTIDIEAIANRILVVVFAVLQFATSISALIELSLRRVVDVGCDDVDN